MYLINIWVSEGEVSNGTLELPTKEDYERNLNNLREKGWIIEALEETNAYHPDYFGNKPEEEDIFWDEPIYPYGSFRGEN